MQLQHFTVINGKIRFDGKCAETKAFCGAVCCRNTLVLLTKEESNSGQFETQEPTEGCNCSACVLMRSSGQRALQRTENGCIYLDGAGQCSIYDKRPQRCRDYQCERVWWGLQLPNKPKEKV